ncbi:MAG: hypothetical protein KF850_35990 [Labilithrix sp.]|nr:hypothetical protein [Labilithrix sp.]
MRSRWGRVRSLLVAGALAVTCAPACGGEAPAPAAPTRAAAPAWADVFDGAPDLYAVIRPRAMQRDALYGAFFKALMRAAQARGIARGDTMVRAVEGADEIIVGVSGGEGGVLVLRGVPASLDPQKVTDAEGRALFRPTSDRATAIEYELVDRRNADAGALFVLPDRTWVGALGDARARARQAFAAPSGRPAPEVEPKALAVVRLGGALVHALDRHPTYGALTRKLSSASFVLEPGKGGLVVGLAYADADAAAWAEMHLKQLIQEIAKDERAPGQAGGWLKEARVAYEGQTVVMRVAVPPRLLEELPSASGADFGL